MIAARVTSGTAFLFLQFVRGFVLFSLAAAGILRTTLPRRQAREDDRASRSTGTRSPQRDGPYLFVLFILVLVGIAFVQYFSTAPIFHCEVHHLSEHMIGILPGMNGLVIFLTGMPLVKYCECQGIGLFRILRFSVLLIALSFVVLYSLSDGGLPLGGHPADDGGGDAQLPFHEPTGL
ncbi:MAG: hypothetical protein H6597_04525 [Flavobacteriales bacterium]|nr:hypothetical protein [Flavobacteriales bacterium]MCB9193778.1 hypothetical protein [Flavobacteriales bacterium]